MAKKVTVIKAAKAQKHTQEERRLKVCGYARVSTGSQAQATSYTAQVEYYTEKIESNPLWEFAGVYADATDIIGLKQNPTKRASL